MKVTCDLSEFQSALSLAGRAISKRAVLPVLSHVLLQTDGNGLIVAGTDLETSIRVGIYARVDEPGAITAPFYTLQPLAGVLEGQDVTLSVNGNATLLVGAGRMNANVKGFEAKEFPPVPDYGVVSITDPGFVSLEIPTAALCKAVARTVISACAEKESGNRPTLTAVYLHRLDGYLALAAADGFRMSRCKTGVEVGEGFTGLLVPASALEEAGRVIAGQADTAHIIFQPGGKCVTIQAGTVQVTTALVEGKYPNVSEVIPKEHAVEIITSAAELKRAVKLAMVFAREEQSNTIRLAIGENKMTLLAENAVDGDQVTVVRAVVTGGLGENSTHLPSEFWLDGRYLRDLLDVISADEVAITGTNAAHPFAFRPIGDDGKDDGFVYVVMPQQGRKPVTE